MSFDVSLFDISVQFISFVLYESLPAPNPIKHRKTRNFGQSPTWVRPAP